MNLRRDKTKGVTEIPKKYPHSLKGSNFLNSTIFIPSILARLESVLSHFQGNDSMAIHNLASSSAIGHAVICENLWNVCVGIMPVKLS